MTTGNSADIKDGPIDEVQAEIDAVQAGNGDMAQGQYVTVTQFNEMKSALEVFDAKNLIGVILTGIGDDGVKGMLELKKHGAVTIAESEESAPVFGMPRCAIEKGAADHIFSLDDMISFFVSEGLIDV